ncbi:MAG: arsenate reductase [Armatimonadetes bacterium]|nr:arsenate reductase [Armatimonadota bacterium]
MEVQIFGFSDDQNTRKAQRFFAERRVKVHFVDLKRRAAQPGELRRFAQKHGLTTLVDRQSKAFAASGLAGRGLSEERWLTLLSEQPRLLRTPLVRCGQQLTVGLDEEAWQGWIDSA